MELGSGQETHSWCQGWCGAYHNCLRHQKVCSQSCCTAKAWRGTPNATVDGGSAGSRIIESSHRFVDNWTLIINYHLISVLYIVQLIISLINWLWYHFRFSYHRNDDCRSRPRWLRPHRTGIGQNQWQPETTVGLQSLSSQNTQLIDLIAVFWCIFFDYFDYSCFFPWRVPDFFSELSYTLATGDYFHDFRICSKRKHKYWEIDRGLGPQNLNRPQLLLLSRQNNVMPRWKVWFLLGRQCAFQHNPKW